MSAHAYHPQTRADVLVDDDAMAHLRAAGWVLKSEWDEQQAAQAAAEADAAKAAAKAAKTGQER